MAELTIQPDGTDGIDSFVNERAPTTNNGTQYYFEVGFRPEGGKKYRAFLKFDLSDIPAGQQIDSAILSIYQWHTNESLNVSLTLSANQITEDWAEGTVTWNAQPAINASAEDTDTNNTLGETGSQWWDWDITDLVAGWYGESITNYGVAIKDNAESSSVACIILYSSDYTDDTSLRPKLVVNYSASAPSAPDVTTNYLKYYRRTRFPGAVSGV